MLNGPFAPWPSFTEEEADVVRNVLLSNKVNYWTGEEGRAFEGEFADFVGSKYAIALANGTLALDAALNALGIGQGDEVVVTPRTFIASVSCIVNAGASPVFADVDLDSQNITADTIRSVLTPRTKAVICVHLAGWPCDMEPIMELAAEHGLFVIEDCAQAHGAQYKGKSVGSIGHIAAWSFCQDKIMSTGGEGGMVTTNDHGLWERIWSYKDHGKSWEAVYGRQHPPGFRWLHESFGTNWRLTEMQSAIGRLQLRRLSDWVEKRASNANELANVMREFECVRIPEPPVYTKHAYYKFYVFIRSKQLASGWDREGMIQALGESGVPCMQGTCSEVYLEKAFDYSEFRPLKRLPNARELGETSMMFLVHPTLTNSDVESWKSGIRKVFSKLSL